MIICKGLYYPISDIADDHNPLWIFQSLLTKQYNRTEGLFHTAVVSKDGMPDWNRIHRRVEMPPERWKRYAPLPFGETMKTWTLWHHWEPEPWWNDSCSNPKSLGEIPNFHGFIIYFWWYKSNLPLFKSPFSRCWNHRFPVSNRHFLRTSRVAFFRCGVWRVPWALGQPGRDPGFSRSAGLGSAFCGGQPMDSGRFTGHPLVMTNIYSYWKWPFVVDLPIKTGDIPWLC